MLAAVNGIGHAAVACDPDFRAALAAHGYTLAAEGEIEQLTRYVGAFSKRAAQISARASRVGDDGSQAGCASVELAAVATSGVVIVAVTAVSQIAAAMARLRDRLSFFMCTRCCPRSTRFAHGLTRVVQVAGKDSRGDQQIVSILRLVDEDVRTAQLATLAPAYPIITRGL